MDKIMAYNFNFPNGDLFCVGADWAINDLRNNFTIQQELGNNITFQVWRKRIIRNQIYCRFEPKGIHGIYIFLLYYFTMKKRHLWITEWAYSEAIYLANQEKVGELLGVTKEETEQIKRETFWKDRFLY